MKVGLIEGLKVEGEVVEGLIDGEDEGRALEIGVGTAVGLALLGEMVGFAEGGAELVGATEGTALGAIVGLPVGGKDGIIVGREEVGLLEGLVVGVKVGAVDGVLVGRPLGMTVGGFEGMDDGVLEGLFVGLLLGDNDVGVEEDGTLVGFKVG